MAKAQNSVGGFSDGDCGRARAALGRDFRKYSVLAPIDTLSPKAGVGQGGPPFETGRREAKATYSRCIATCLPLLLACMAKCMCVCVSFGHQNSERPEFLFFFLGSAQGGGHAWCALRSVNTLINDFRLMTPSGMNVSPHLIALFANGALFQDSSEKSSYCSTAGDEREGKCLVQWDLGQSLCQHDALFPLEHATRTVLPSELKRECSSSGSRSQSCVSPGLNSVF